MHGGINRCAALHYLYALASPDIVSTVSIKKGNGEGAMGSRSRPEIMESNKELKNGTTQKKSKKENARDIISKSIQGVCGKKTGTIEKIYNEKLGFTIGYPMGSRSKTGTMKSYRILKNEAEQKLNKQKEGKRSGYNK